ncbi:MAG: transcriptional regulator HexR [Pseudomonadales bacterium]
MRHANLLQNISKNLTAMRKSERKVAEYVLAHPDEVIHMRIVDLAQESEVSEPTVVRFCRAISCDGFQDFKLGLAQQLASTPSFSQFSVNTEDSPVEYAYKVFDATIHTLSRVRDALDTNIISQATDVINAARRISFYGFGASAAVAQDAQHKFFRLGMSTVAYSDPHIQNMAAMSLQEGDVVVAISQSGRTKALLNSIALVQAEGGVVIGLAPSASPVANRCDISICVDVDEDNDFYAPQSSRIAQLTVVDVLAVGVSQARDVEITTHLEKLRQGLSTLRLPNDSY